MSKVEPFIRELFMRGDEIFDREKAAFRDALGYVFRHLERGEEFVTTFSHLSGHARQDDEIASMHQTQMDAQSSPPPLPSDSWPDEPDTPVDPPQPTDQPVRDEAAIKAWEEISGRKHWSREA